MCFNSAMRAYLAAFAVIALLAGCAPGGGGSALDPTPTPSSSASKPTASSSPTPTPTPTADPVPTVAAKPELADLIISHEGLGPVAVGTVLTSLDPSLSIFASRIEDCGDGVPITLWQANFPEQGGLIGGDGRVRTAFESGSLPGDVFDFVHVYASGPRTVEGIRVGSSRAELIAAYPGITIASTSANRDRYAVYGSPANLFFDVPLAGTTDSVDNEKVVIIGLLTSELAVFRPSNHGPGAVCI